MPPDRFLPSGATTLKFRREQHRRRPDPAILVPMSLATSLPDSARAERPAVGPPAAGPNLRLVQAAHKGPVASPSGGPLRILLIVLLTLVAIFVIMIFFAYGMEI